MLHCALRYIKLAVSLNLPGYLENPRASRLWKVPAILKLVKHGMARFIDLDMCQYGVAWRKPTRLLVWCTPTDMDLCKCHTKNNLCSRSGKRHLQLTGLSGGRFLTAAAQVYPKAFGEALAILLYGPPTSTQ